MVYPTIWSTFEVDELLEDHEDDPIEPDSVVMQEKRPDVKERFPVLWLSEI